MLGFDPAELHHAGVNILGRYYPEEDQGPISRQGDIADSPALTVLAVFNFVNLGDLLLRLAAISGALPVSTIEVPQLRLRDENTYCRFRRLAKRAWLSAPVDQDLHDTRCSRLHWLARAGRVSWTKVQ